LREFSSGDPNGISLMFASMQKWMYDFAPVNNSPTTGLKFEEALNQLKHSISTSKSAVFQQLIKDLILNNNHRVTLDLYPSATIEAENLQVNFFENFDLFSYPVLKYYACALSERATGYRAIQGKPK